MRRKPRKRKENKVPVFNFECKNKKCGKEYEELAAYDETGKYKGVTCPHCGSKKKKKIVSCCSYAFSNPVGTDKWNSESSGHDYRFKHNLPKVIEQRKNAEMMSHMGANP